jgi:hypothetical protein
LADRQCPSGGLCGEFFTVSLCLRDCAHNRSQRLQLLISTFDKCTRSETVATLRRFPEHHKSAKCAQSVLRYLFFEFSLLETLIVYFLIFR